MELKTRLLAGGSTLALAASVLAATAPAAHATPNTVGSCTGEVLIATSTPAQTNVSAQLTLATKPAQDQTVAARPKLTGSCGFNGPALTPTNLILRLSGFGSCNASATPNGAPLFGKLIIATSIGAQQGYVSVLGLGQGANYADVVDIGGILTKGALAGATIRGSLWEDAASKIARADPSWPGFRNSGYEPDLVQAANCSAGTTSVTTALLGDGPSPFEAVAGPMLCAQPPCNGATGLLFTWGE